MQYLVSNAGFTKITEPKGTLQNISRTWTIEVSNTTAENSGVLLPPMCKIQFDGDSVYVRCVDGSGAEARVIPFEVVVKGGDGGTDFSIDQTGTTIVEDFRFSALEYPGATDPGLNGKTVLVMAVKDANATTAQVKYVFVDFAKLGGAAVSLKPSDNAIGISGASIGLNLSTSEENILSIKDDGLYAGLCIADGVSGNFAIIGESGAIVDGGFSIADLIGGGSYGGGASYAVFDGATSITSGTSGLVPAPAVGDQQHFLRGDGTWARADVGSVVLDTVASGIEGALWKGSVDGAPVLILRHGSGEYSFNYDEVTFVGSASSGTETVEPDTYIIGNASVSSEGGIWYEDDAGVTKLYFHSGSYNYALTYDAVKYVGSQPGLCCYLPLNVKTTVDALGNTWTNYGSPSIQNHALYLNGSSYLQLDDVATLLGRSSMYTIDFWATPTANQGTFFHFLNGLVSNPASSSNGWIKLDLYQGTIRIVGSGNDAQISYPYALNTRHHFALTYNGTTYKLYGDGQLLLTKDRTTTAVGALTIGGSSADTVVKGLSGYIDHFRIFKDTVLWTSNFTPPTAADYN